MHAKFKEVDEIDNPDRSNCAGGGNWKNYNGYWYAECNDWNQMIANMNAYWGNNRWISTSNFIEFKVQP